ncbi:MAG: PHP domain-containing protein [Candidatus Roizmanbacteria bacterium]|nr:MAG: PHP domain-containing protein [Candidatus Roizmanbacteria bacterium]
MGDQEKFTNKVIAQVLRSVAAAYLLKGENRFKIIAYDNAAGTVEHMNRELKDIWQEGKIHDVPGIGPSISEHLTEYFKKGHSSHFDRILKGIPSAVFTLMNVSFIGPKRALKLVKALHLFNSDTAINDLKEACLSDKVSKIPTFGKKSQDDILLSIELYEQSTKKTERMPLPYASELAQEVVEYLKKLPWVIRADALGSLRRMVATVGDIDVAVAAEDKNASLIIDKFINFPRMIRVDNAGGKKASIIVSPNIRVDLRTQSPATYGSMLQYLTGSKSHNIKLREYALKKGYSLSEYGLKPLKKIQNSNVKFQNYNSKSKILEFKDEPWLYNFLGLDYIEPELREGTDEIDIALKHDLPVLVNTEDIKGDMHVHSSYDLQPSHDRGANSFEEMIEKAIELKYKYIGFSEHNPRQGLGADEMIKILKKRKENIENIFKKKKYNLNYFIGLEVDILPNGELAIPKKALDYLDYIVASVHSSFRINSKDMTKRILKALSFPKVKILGHPTTRLLGKREGIDADWEQIFKETKKRNIALEINSFYDRLDLPDTLVKLALNNDNLLIINTDSHFVESMEYMVYGVSVARRGWATKNDIINTREYNEVREWIGV